MPRAQVEGAQDGFVFGFVLEAYDADLIDVEIAQAVGGALAVLVDGQVFSVDFEEGFLAGGVVVGKPPDAEREIDEGDDINKRQRGDRDPEADPILVAVGKEEEGGGKLKSWSL